MENFKNFLVSLSPKNSPTSRKNTNNEKKAEKLEKQKTQQAIKAIWFNHPNEAIRQAWQQQLLTGFTHDPLKIIMVSTESRDYYLNYHPKDNRAPKLIAHFEPTTKTVITYIDDQPALSTSYEEFLAIFRK
jgi:hypothetical protein